MDMQIIRQDSCLERPTVWWKDRWIRTTSTQHDDRGVEQVKWGAEEAVSLMNM